MKKKNETPTIKGLEQQAKIEQTGIDQAYKVLKDNSFFKDATDYKDILEPEFNPSYSDVIDKTANAYIPYDIALTNLQKAHLSRQIEKGINILRETTIKENKIGENIKPTLSMACTSCLTCPFHNFLRNISDNTIVHLCGMQQDNADDSTPAAEVPSLFESCPLKTKKIVVELIT